MALRGEDEPLEALKWLRQAAEQGHATAQCLLGERLKGAEATRWLHEAVPRVASA